MASPISQYEAERWRQLHDELVGQATRLEQLLKPGTRGEWEALDAIKSASRSLFSAFGWVMREREEP